MRVKHQLHACRDSLMVAVRAAQQATSPDPQVLKTLRACHDMIEQLEAAPTDASSVQIDLALTVVTQALVEFGRKPDPAPAVLGAVRNAVDLLQRLRTEFPA